MPRPNALRRYGKPLASAAVSLAAYLAGVLPAEGGLDDLSLAQWMLAVVAVGGAFGVTAAVPKGDEVVRVDSDGQLRAGPAALQQTNIRLGGGARLEDLMPVDRSGMLQEE